MTNWARCAIWECTLAVLATMATTIHVAQAANVLWVGPNGSYWDLPANWNPGLPGPADTASLGAFNTEFRMGTVPVQSFSGTGVLTVSNGALSAANASSVGGLTMTNGSIGGAGNLTVTGTATLTFGDHYGAGTTTLQGASTIGGSGFRLDGGRTLRNEGTLTWNAGEILFNNNVSGNSFPGSGTLNNVAGATFVASGDAAAAIAATNFGGGDTGADALVSNAGTFRKSGSSASHTTTIGVLFNNSGTVEVETGILRQTIGGTHTGNFAVSSGAVLDFSSASVTINGGAVSLPGTVRLNSAGPTVNVNTDYAIAGTTAIQGGVLNVSSGTVTTGALTQSSGAVGGPGNLTVTGDATLTFGDHHGTGTTTLQGASTIGGSGFRLDGGRTLRNEGTLTWSAGEILFNNNVSGNTFPGSGTLNNVAGATFVASGDAAAAIAATNFGGGDTGADALFTNAGTFRKSGSSASHTTTIGVAFVNAGTVDVQTGIIQLPNDFTNNGTLKGIAKYATNALNNGGHVAPGESPGTLTLSGDYAQAVNGFLDIELVNRYAADKFVVSGSATLGGTLALQCVACAVRTNDEYVVLQATGTLTGTFANTTNTGFGAGFAYSVVYDYAGGKVKVRILHAGSQPGLTVYKYGTGGGTVTSGDGHINCGILCSHAYADGTPVTLTAAAASGSTFTGWLGAPTCIGTGECQVTVSGATAVRATFAANPIEPRLDVDANTHSDPLTDGLLILRDMFGLTGADLTVDALGLGATRVDPVVLGWYLEDIAPYLDADGNGEVDALTDGMLIFRYLLGLAGSALTEGAVGPGATRPDSDTIATHLGTLGP